MPVEIDILVIGPRLHQHRVTVAGGVDALLDSGVVGRDIDYGTLTDYGKTNYDNRRTT
jgi:hypothetical protein